jgi:HemK-related putative methylase
MSAPTAAATVHAQSLARLPLLRRLLGRALHLGYRAVGAHRYDDYRMETVCGAHFVVLPTVFNPRSTRTGTFLASRIDPGPVRGDWDVLDMGTGSGVGAIVAARHARRVVAVDINPAAVRCARINAQINQAEDRMDVRIGDLFEPVAGQRFHLVLFNPPFLHAQPRNQRDSAWRATEVAGRFAAGLGDHLLPGGMALVVLSTFGDGLRFLQQLDQHGFRCAAIAQRGYINERLTLFQVTA